MILQKHEESRKTIMAVLFQLKNQIIMPDCLEDAVDVLKKEPINLVFTGNFIYRYKNSIYQNNQKLSERIINSGEIACVLKEIKPVQVFEYSSLRDNLSYYTDGVIDKTFNHENLIEFISNIYGGMKK